MWFKKAHMGISRSKEDLEYMAMRRKQGTRIMVERYASCPSLAEINHLVERAMFHNLCIVVVLGHGTVVDKAELAKFDGKPRGLYTYGKA